MIFHETSHHATEVTPNIPQLFFSPLCSQLHANTHMIPALTVGDLVRWPMSCVFPDHCISKAVGGIRGPQLAQTASNCYPGRDVKNPSFFYAFLRVKDGFSTGKRRVTESGVMIFFIERRVFYGWNTGFHTRKTGFVPKTYLFFEKSSESYESDKIVAIHDCRLMIFILSKKLIKHSPDYIHL